MRAIDIIVAAGATGAKLEALLQRLIDPSANFDLIIGDAIAPGTGAAGDRQLPKV